SRLAPEGSIWRRNGRDLVSFRGGAGRVHSKKPRPAPPPIFTIAHRPPSPWNSITSPFENLAATRLPLTTTPWTLASSNDLRNALEGGVQFSIFPAPTRSQAIRSHRG